ncbi:MAG: hypothetical protein JWL72_4174 [Ilumatobacteraceae bacterium]|nr:hypothetical protein [Ilumatobacteraceae bacterium]MCU1390836.1 hypothetical protein [Ilumatobacteraceae bacterium]
MNEPPPETPDGAAARRFLDRSQQAARFLDLTRQRELEPDAGSGMLLPLVAAHLQGALAPASNGALDDADDLGADDIAADGLILDDLATGDDAADDIRIDPSAFTAMRPGSIPSGAGLGAFSLDDDGDVFGDGNGFGSTSPFGSDDGEVL